MAFKFPETGDLRFGEFTLRVAARELRKDDQALLLTEKAFDLLAYMAANPGRPLLKGELLTAVWPDTVVEESNLSQNVFLLRKTLGTGNETPIRTLPGRGYQFVAEVSRLFPAAAEHPLREMPQSTVSIEATSTRLIVEEESEETARQPRLLRLAGLSILGLLVLAVAGWLGWRAWQRWQDRTGGPPVQAVLIDIDGTTGDPVLDRSLTQALRMDLAQSPYVSLLSTATVRATLGQMKHATEGIISADAAREVCERTNSQAVLHGTVARTGQHYLLTEEATNCVNNAVLAETKQEVSTAEELPRGIDRIAEGLRRQLGESRRSIAHFDVPLFAGNTSSLEALKYFSQGTVQAGQGKYVDAIALLKKAVAADPSFAEAYYDLAAYYRSTDDFSAERQAILEAYRLRSSAGESTRLAIIALYHSSATEDLYEAERNYRNWTELYPRSAQAWNGLSVVERDLGHNADALIAARRALELKPEISGLYTNMAYSQIKLGDFQGALTTCQRAVARGLDGDYVRDYYLQTAYNLHDPVLVQQQRDWAAEHPDAVFVRLEELEIANAEGRFADVRRLLPPVVALMRHQGLDGPADDVIRVEASNLIEDGDVPEGLQLSKSVPFSAMNELSVVLAARTGEGAAAEAALQGMQAEFPQGTIWNDYRGPEVRAISALATHRPKDAVAALERIRPLEGRDPDMTRLRADAYLAAGEPELAEKSYRQVVDGSSPLVVAEEIPLCWLGLGRAYAALGKQQAAVQAYQRFLALWNHADPDALYLRQARLELARLNPSGP